MVETLPEGNVNIQALRQWCAFNKSDKHSDSDCRAQQDTDTSTAQTPKKRPLGATKKDKPRRPGMSNVRPAGRMRPAKGLNAAREKIFLYVMHVARERI